MNDVTARRLVVLAKTVPPLLESLDEPETAIQRARASVVELLQPGLRERREILGDFVFYATMQEEIAARVVALEAMLSERGYPA